jgi:DNA primase
MSGRFGDDKIAEVRERTSIVELVSRYTALKRTGRSHMGLCPLHAEKTPSFSVSEERGFFHCFGCQASGDVFKFLMLRDGLTFPEALERLAREAGIELPRHPAEGRRAEARDRFLRVNAFAVKYFQRALWETVAGEVARAYLAKRRIEEETARRFALGYAPPEGLARALERAGAPLGDAQSLGLIGPSQTGGWYDRYRHRLMFPILDLSSNPIGFGGRLLGSAEGQAKYINSSDSPVFHKGRSVYNLQLARDAIHRADRVLLVEGYVDVIALVQAGIGNVVAPLGTALTADQVRLLRRFTDKFTVLFDGDEAGISAAARSFEVFAEVGHFPEAALLPPGHDPDTYIHQFGAEGMLRLVENATPLVDHYLQKLAAANASLAVRAQAARTVAELCERLGDPVFVGLLRRHAAGYLDISEEQLKTKRGGARPAAPPFATPPPVRPRTIAAQKLTPHELALAEILLVHPELGRSLPDDLDDVLSSDDARALFDRLRAADSSSPPTDLASALPPEAADRVARAWLGEGERYAAPEQLLQDGLAKLRGRARESRLKALSREIRDAESRGDGEALRTLLAEKQRLAAESEGPP